MESYLNCLLTLIGLPLGVFVLAYGVYLLVNGSTDHGLFLMVLGALLLIAVASGYTGPYRRKKLIEKLEEPENEE